VSEFKLNGLEAPVIVAAPPRLELVPQSTSKLVAAPPEVAAVQVMEAEVAVNTLKAPRVGAPGAIGRVVKLPMVELVLPEAFTAVMRT
jgi:hypothetical protein